MAAHHVPGGHGTVSPYLVTKHAEQVIRLMEDALQGREIHRSTRPDGTIMHAEVKIGDSVVMIGEACAEFPAMPCMVHVYVPDCDAAYHRALELGVATSVREPARQFYGDRSAGVRDAGGNQWWIATHEEDVAHDELERRARAAGQG